jgi:hypothetical protein
VPGLQATGVLPVFEGGAGLWLELPELQLRTAKETAIRRIELKYDLVILYPDDPRISLCTGLHKSV